MAASKPAGQDQLTDANKTELFRRFSEWESRGTDGPASPPAPEPAGPAGSP